MSNVEEATMKKQKKGESSGLVGNDFLSVSHQVDSCGGDGGNEVNSAKSTSVAFDGKTVEFVNPIAGEEPGISEPPATAAEPATAATAAAAPTAATPTDFISKMKSYTNVSPNSSTLKSTLLKAHLISLELLRDS